MFDITRRLQGVADAFVAAARAHRIADVQRAYLERRSRRGCS